MSYFGFLDTFLLFLTDFRQHCHASDRNIDQNPQIPINGGSPVPGDVAAELMASPAATTFMIQQQKEPLHSITARNTT